jgi:hypothetical protein
MRTNPGVQNPHWNALASMKACWTASSSPFFSMVTI